MQTPSATSTLTQLDSSQALPYGCPCMKENSGIVEQKKTIPTKRLLQTNSNETAKRKRSQEITDSPGQIGIICSQMNSELTTAFSPNTNTIFQDFEQIPDGASMAMNFDGFDPLHYSEAAYGAHPQVSATETLLYSGFSFPTDPCVDTALRTLSTCQLALEEVADVHPANFLALSKLEGTTYLKFL